MTSEIRTAKAATSPRPLLSSRPLNLPTAEQIRRNLAAVYRDQIVSAARASNDESLDYWLARYVELVGSEPSASQSSRRTQRRARTTADRSDQLPSAS
jgi:hypothetical protein